MDRGWYDARCRGVDLNIPDTDIVRFCVATHLTGIIMVTTLITHALTVILFGVLAIRKCVYTPGTASDNTVNAQTLTLQQMNAECCKRCIPSPVTPEEAQRAADRWIEADRQSAHSCCVLDGCRECGGCDGGRGRVDALCCRFLYTGGCCMVYPFKSSVIAAFGAYLSLFGTVLSLLIYGIAAGRMIGNRGLNFSYWSALVSAGRTCIAAALWSPYACRCSTALITYGQPRSIASTPAAATAIAAADTSAAATFALLPASPSSSSDAAMPVKASSAV